MTLGQGMTSQALPNAPFTCAGTGMSRADVYRLVAVGAVRQVLRGVFVDASIPDTVELRAAAAACVVAPHNIAVDRTAATIHGVDTYAFGERDAVPPVETCALRGHTRTRLVGTDGHIRDLAPGDIMTIGGVRLTTPLRTACDLGCRLRRREAYAAMVALARQHHLAGTDFSRMLRRYGRRRGVVQLRELVPLIDPRLESPREAWTYLAIHDAGLPHPVPQHWIVIDGVPTFRLDFAYVHARVCVEYDGADHHDAPEQREHDEERRDWLRAHGWTVIVVRSGDFTDEALDRWLKQLREALRPPYDPRRW